MEDFAQDFSALFGARLKDERRRMGRTQHAFGEIGGVGKLAQLNYEKGGRMPSVDYLRRLGEHGVDIAYLLTGERTTSKEIDTDLLAACISAINSSCAAAGLSSRSADDIALFTALLYQFISQTSGSRATVADMASAIVSGWVLANDKKSA